LVHTFQWHLMKFIENTFKSPLKKTFTWWVCSPIKKNRKKLLNVTCHNEDFGAPAEWHFLATSHGKSACDGVGGTLKSLQRPYNDQIITPRQLYEWAQSSICNLNFYFVTGNEYKEEEGSVIKLICNIWNCTLNLAAPCIYAG
jgi:hypothetical protein